ncbi:MAG: hypothetical protein L6V93_05835 [Clostridiales bacterium]|nr:MAG: hypothetical protein L6V93_05835 [Clostridiales bacterium]
MGRSRAFRRAYPKNPEKEELFSDLQGFDWAKDAVENMAEKGYTFGSRQQKNSSRQETLHERNL